MGRKSLKDEAVMADVINKSWMTIRDILNSKVVPQERKEEIALKIVEKSVPKDIYLGGHEDSPIVITWRVNGKDYRPTPEPVESVGEPEQI